MKASERPTCPLCASPVYVKDSAWISHLFGWTVHLDCVEKEGAGWYRRLIQQ